MIINPYVFGGFDPDAQAFITAAGITDNTQKTAINTLVLDLKGYLIWTKFKAIFSTFKNMKSLLSLTMRSLEFTKASF